MAQNYKKDLLAILDRAQVEVNRFNTLKAGIDKDYKSEVITDIGREKKMIKLLDETGAHIEQLQAEALQIIDNGLDALSRSWDKKTVDAYSDATLSNIIMMLNNGAIPSEEELNALIEPYKDNPTAIESIKKALDKNGATLMIQFEGEAIKERTRRLIGQMRMNFVSHWHKNAITSLPMHISGTMMFLERCADDLTVSQ